MGTTISFYACFGCILPIWKAQQMWGDLTTADADEYQSLMDNQIIRYPVIYEFVNDKDTTAALTDDKGNFIRIYEKSDSFAGAWTHKTKVEGINSFSDIWGPSKFSETWSFKNYETLLGDLR